MQRIDEREGFVADMEKLRRGVEARTRGGDCTPSFVWKFRFPEVGDDDDDKHEFDTIKECRGCSTSANVSARQLGAYLWEQINRQRLFKNKIPELADSNLANNLNSKQFSKKAGVKSLKIEVDQSCAQARKSLAYGVEIDPGKNKAGDRIKTLTPVRSVHKDEENLRHEVSVVKASLSKALEDLQREREARVLIEGLCDQLANGISDYEQKVRPMKLKPNRSVHPSSRGNQEPDPDRRLLHISEAWLDARTQMRNVSGRSEMDPGENEKIADRLGFQIETFLRARESGGGEKADCSENRNGDLPERMNWRVQVHQSSKNDNVVDGSLKQPGYARHYCSIQSHGSKKCSLKEKLLEARIEARRLRLKPRRSKSYATSNNFGESM